MARAYALAIAGIPSFTRALGKGAKGESPFTYEKLPQTPTPNPVRKRVAQASRLCLIAYPFANLTNLPDNTVLLTLSKAKLTGKVNRRGPALPGLR